MAGRPAVFLDRDGTIIAHVPYLGHPADVRLLPHAAEGIRRLRAAGLSCYLVSNQGGVALGYFTLDDVEAVHARMLELLAAGGAGLDGIAFCPHHPRGTVPGFAGACACRKPGTGMVEDLARRYGLDPAQSHLAGDSPVDVECARRAGCAPLLVRGPLSAEVPPDIPRVADLGEAADRILGGR